MRLIAAAAIAAFALAGTAAAADGACTPKFDFEGLHIGDQGNDHTDRCAAYGDAVNEIVRCVKTIWSGSTRIETEAYYIDDKLAGLKVNYSSGDFDAVIAAYTQKFGCAPSLRHLPATNGFGGALDQQLATWHTTDGDFSLAKYQPGVAGEGSGFLFGPALDAKLHGLGQQAAGALAGKL